MIPLTKKKIYLIGSNPFDLSDLTFQALNLIHKSDLIILSKSFSTDFFKMFKKQNIILREDLKFKSHKHFLEKIVNLFSENNLISHLINGDPIIDYNGRKEQKFFNKYGIMCESISGVIHLTNYLNRDSSLLTNREKNSSVTFIKPFNRNRVFTILDNLYFEKLVIFLHEESELIEIRSIIKELLLEKRVEIKFINNKKINSFYNLNSKNIEESGFPYYIIIENNEKLQTNF